MIANTSQSTLANILVDRLYFGIIVLDRDANVTLWNKWLERHSGLPSVNIVGRNLFEVFPDIRDRGYDKRILECIHKTRPSLMSPAIHSHLIALVISRGEKRIPMKQIVRIYPLLGVTETSGAIIIIEDVTESMVHQEEILKLNRLLEAIRKVNQLISKAESEEEVFENTCRILVDVAQYAVAWIKLTRENTDPLENFVVRNGAFYSKSAPAAAIDSCEDVNTLAGVAIAEGRPQTINQLRVGNPNHIIGDDAIEACFQSLCALPLKLNGKVFGYLGIISDNEHAFEGDGLLLIQEVADDIAFKLRTLKDAELRRLAEKELFLSEKRLEMVLEGADLGWWDRNTLTDNVTRSQRWAQMLGYSLDEIGPYVADWEQLIHPEDRDRVKQLLEDHLESRTPSYQSEHRLRTKYGDWIWILERGKIMERDKNGQPLRITGTHLDITDRKLMEEGLRRSEEKFSTAFQLSPEPITISRVIDGKYVSVNERFNKLSGYTEQEVIGKTALEFNLWEETEEGNRLAEKLKTEGKFEGLECCFRRKNGEIRHGLVSSAIIDINGEPHIITVIKDITDLKRAEQERENLRAQLIQSQKIEALGTLVGGIAHDFNNMLQSMLGYSELLLTGKKEGEPGYKELQTVIKVGEGGAELVKKLLAFGQQAQVITISIDLNEQIRRLNKLISRTLPNIVQVDLDLANGQTKINADRGQIDQLVMNLAINASEAMPNGGWLKISTRTVSFDGEYCRNCKGVKSGSYVMLSVMDTGRGMDKETLARIFDPFFSTKQRGSTRGTGLGLSVVQGIAQQHGGHITCESAPGKGTEFKIYFPAIEEPLADVKTFSPTIQTEGSETILLVEDCSPVAELEAGFLGSAGYSVVIATNGREALDIYRKRKQEISLVLLDLIMPVMSGRDCLMELVKIDPSVKVLIASGYAPEDELRSEISPIVKGFLHKPFAISQLLTGVRSALDGA